MIENAPPKGRVLMKDGAWLVPPEERPRNWELMGMAEPKASTVAAASEPPQLVGAALLADVITATDAQVEKLCGCGKPIKHQGMCSVRAEIGKRTKEQRRTAAAKRAKGFSAIERAIRESAKNVGAKYSLLDVALVLVAGMWTRDPWELRALLHIPIDQILRAIRGIELYGLWKEDMTVELGKLGRKHGGDFELWLRAMAANGEIFMGYDGQGERVFSATPVAPVEAHP